MVDALAMIVSEILAVQDGIGAHLSCINLLEDAANILVRHGKPDVAAHCYEQACASAFIMFGDGSDKLRQIQRGLAKCRTS